MNDSNEGPSSAAQGAQETPEAPQTDSGGSFIDWVLRRRGRRDTEMASVRVTANLSPEESADQRRMLLNLRNLYGKRVEDVAIPRADMVAVSVDTPRDTLLKIFRESGYSRIPVYGETPDDPLGLVHFKDLFLSDVGQEESFDLRALLRPLLFAPPSMPIGALLQKMQSERMHMALVIDEYGGTDGLVTMEDLVEQIVGEIADEHDTDEDRMWIEESPGVYRALARADLEDFETAARVDLLPDDLDEDVDTLGGLVFMIAGRVPARGEVVVHPQGHEFEVLDADPRRIKRMRIRLRDEAALERAAE